jgi:hypothetical protein
VAVMPVRGLARWRCRRGEPSQLPQAEVVLVASPAQNGVGFSYFYTTTVILTVFVHAALGDAGPRWQPLNGADRHALWARRQLESVLAGGNDDGGIKCDRTTTALVHRLGSGWWRHWRSGPISPATESKFVYLVIWLVFVFYSAFLSY